MSFRHVVFAGGGCRCFWQAGFWTAAAPQLGWQPRRVHAVSAGAALSAAVFAGRAEETLTTFQRATAANERNWYWRNIGRPEPVFPHYGMYRGAILEVLDNAAMNALRRAPEIRVLLARPPGRLGPRTSVLVGLVAYQLERAFRNPVHTRAGRLLGFRPEWVTLQDCANAGDVADLVLASSSTPPFTPVLPYRGRPVLDGGIVDPVPVDGIPPSEGRALVLLTRRYDALPQVEGRTYVQPSKPIPVKKWDYTSPDLLQATWELGLRDGERFAEESLRQDPPSPTANPRFASTGNGVPRT